MICLLLDDERPESKDLLKFLTDYCKHWRDIGLLLGLQSSILDLVASAHPMQDRECFRVTLEKWLQLNVGVTWENLELAITNANRASLGLQPLTSDNKRTQTDHANGLYINKYSLLILLSDKCHGTCPMDR